MKPEEIKLLSTNRVSESAAKRFSRRSIPRGETVRDGAGHSTRSAVVRVGTATAIDRAMQFLTPIVLVRLLDVHDFGIYRVFWLIVLTSANLAPLGMPRSLMFYLPRVEEAEKSKYVANTLLFLGLTGLVVALLVAPWNEEVTIRLGTAGTAGQVLPFFLFLWVMTSVMDFLPSANEHFRWQAWMTIALSMIRAATIIGVAFVTRDVQLLIVFLLLFSVLRFIVAGYYIFSNYGTAVFSINRRLLGAQLRYSVPFGVGGALYGLWTQAEHWIVLMLFKPAQYALFSVAAYMQPLVDIVRGSISMVVLPKLNQLHGAGDVRGMLALNERGNIVAAFVLFPVLGFLFIFAGEIVEILFTKRYLDAVPAMRIYLIGMARVVLDTTAVMTVLGQGRYTLIISGSLLLVAIIVSYTGASLFGMAGAALGSVTALYVELYFTLRRTSRLLEMPIAQIVRMKELGVLFGAVLICGGIVSTILAMTTLVQPVARLALGLVTGSVLYFSILWGAGFSYLITDTVGMFWQKRRQ